MAEKETNKTLRDLMAVFFRHGMIFLFCAALFAIVVFTAVQFVHPEYTASTKFERRLGQALSEQGLSGVSGTDIFEAVKQTQIEDLSGQKLVQPIAAELGEFSGHEGKNALPHLPQGIQASDNLWQNKLKLVDGGLYINSDEGMFEQTGDGPAQKLQANYVYRWNEYTQRFEPLYSRAMWLATFKHVDGTDPSPPDKPSTPTPGCLYFHPDDHLRTDGVWYQWVPATGKWIDLGTKTQWDKVAQDLLKRNETEKFLSKPLDSSLLEPNEPQKDSFWANRLCRKSAKTDLKNMPLKREHVYKWTCDNEGKNGKWEEFCPLAMWEYLVAGCKFAKEMPPSPAARQFLLYASPKQISPGQQARDAAFLTEGHLYQWPSTAANWLEVCDYATWKKEADRFNARIETIRKKMIISWEVKSQKVDVVGVSLTDPDRDFAWLFLNRLVRNYVSNIYARNHKLLSDSHEFLAKKNSAFQSELGAQEKLRVDLETKHPGVNAEQHQQIIWVEQRIAADAEAVERLLRIAEAKLAKIKAQKKPTTQLVETEIVRGPNPEHERLGAELQKYKEELDLALTLRCMTPDHPAVKTLQERINIMEKRIRETPEEIDLQKILREGGGGELYEAQKAAAEAEVDILSAELDRVQTQVAGYKKMNQDLEKPRKEYIACLAKMEAIKIEAKNWQERLRQVEMALAAEAQNLRIQTSTIEDARRPLLPSNPKFMMIVGVALVGAMIFGGLIIFGIHRKDRSIWTSQLAESALGVPVYGVISATASPGKRFFRGTARWTLGLALLALVLVSGYMFKWNLKGELAPDPLRPMQSWIFSTTGRTLPAAGPTYVPMEPSAPAAPQPTTAPATPVASDDTSSVGRPS